MTKIQPIAIALLSIAMSTACGASRSTGARGASELPTKVAHAKPRALPDERAAAEPPPLETPTEIVPIEHIFSDDPFPGESPQAYMLRCCTPIALVFDESAGIELRADDGLGSFDLSPAQNGSGVRTDWLTAATPWLALDRDGDGAITSGRELFGAATELASGITSDHGFDALAELDEDGDGDVDDGDPGFASLVAWADDGDRRSEPSELTALADLGVVAIDLHVDASRPSCDERGNCEVERAELRWRTRSGALRTGAAVDIHFAPR